MRSVVVVLPASMWAMMPMFLQRSKGTVLDTLFFRSSLRTSCSPTVFTGLPIIKTSSSSSQPLALSSPPIMREGLVGLGHAVHVFLLLDRGAAAIGGVQQFVAQLVDHSLF